MEEAAEADLVEDHVAEAWAVLVAVATVADMQAVAAEVWEEWADQEVLCTMAPCITAHVGTDHDQFLSLDQDIIDPTVTDQAIKTPTIKTMDALAVH